MRPPALRLYDGELIVDSFAGGGGASLAIEQSLGRSPDVAINHDADAIRMHRTNHPATRHYCEDVWAVDPLEATAGKRVGLFWLSPDCKHFSKAKGGKPVEKNIRGLAWVAVKWVKVLGTRKPRVIVLENVEEFQDWGPLLEDGRPCPLRKGFTFRRFVNQLERLGYKVEFDELIAADYGAPTTRKRLFLIARSDGEAIAWPAPTHGKGRLPWRPAAECIEWSLPCPSIFERIRPLADNTLRRIARGIRKYVIDAARPFIVPITHTGDDRVHAIDEPLRTITGAHRGEHALIAPTLITSGYGERPGQAPRVPGLDKPIGTLVGTLKHALVAAHLSPFNGIKGGETRGSSPADPMRTQTGDPKHALVAAFLAKHYGGHETPGAPPAAPLSTVTAQDHHALIASSLVKLKGTSQHGQAVDVPLHTVQACGNHYAEVRAFLIGYHSGPRGGGQGGPLDHPTGTVTSRDRLGLVTVAGAEYAIADIGMRMLQPRELFRAQGFPDTYLIDRDAEGKPFTKSAQVRMCGNSVCPPVAAAILVANFATHEQVIQSST